MNQRIDDNLVFPNFLIIGAEKTGTTALTQFLSQHPDICFSRPVETRFFNQNYEKGIAWFASHFEHCKDETAIGEGTARLLQSEEAPARIHTHIPDAKLFCILRNPIDRAFSQYHFYVYTGKAGADRSFGEVIRDPESEFGQDIIQQGRYIDHLRRYEGVFEREQLHVYLYDTFRNAPMDVVQSIYERLDVDPSFTPEASSKHNVTQYPASRGVYHMLRSGWQMIRGKAERHFPHTTERLRRRVRSLFFDTEKPEMNARDRSFLQAQYAESNKALEAYLDTDLSHWT